LSILAAARAASILGNRRSNLSENMRVSIARHGL
jgi:hypothetical protein